MSVLGNSQLLMTPEGYQISRSVRLRSSASAYFNRTAGTQTSNIAWSYSLWIKRGLIASASNSYISQAQNGGNTLSSEFFIATDDTLVFREYGPSAYTSYLQTTQVFRDPSAWYHVLLVYNAANGTSGDRVRMYVNGVRVSSFSTATYPSSTSQATAWNTSGNVQKIGFSGTNTFDGYLTEVNFIDGQALTPSSFGETDAITGVWKPKRYTGAYGTNGFYLNFSDNSAATAAAIGKDSSGNGNNWTPNNISVTAGVTYDSMIDVPTAYADGGNGRGNYCVLNPLDKGTNVTLLDGNLKASVGTTGSHTSWVRSSFGVTSGKWYVEFAGLTTANSWMVGICQAQTDLNAAVYSSSTAWLYNAANGNVISAGSTVQTNATWTSSNTIGIVFDADSGTLQWYKDNVAQGTALTGLTSGPYFFVVGYASSATAWTAAINFGQRPFTYTPPTGFKALNTFNLPDATIKKGNQHFDVALYSGNSGTNSITGIAFQPDLVWDKCRNVAVSHALFNSVVGATKYLSSDATTAETTDSTSLTSFDSGGFTLGSGTFLNNAGRTYAAWLFKAGGASGSSNTSGSITSTVSVNASAGFSIVTYTGTGANATVGHGLGVAPKLVIIKNRDYAQNWPVWFTGFTGSEYLTLNTTTAKSTDSTLFNSTSPTSSVFSIGTANQTNFSTAKYVAYCWAEVAGFSKFGSYTGNGSSDGPFVFLGFRPRFILLKNTGYDNSQSWVMYDTSRSTYNVDNVTLQPNSSNAESTSFGADIDVLSNGFKIRNGNTVTNASGTTIIYAAFAENPFKNALAR